MVVATEWQVGTETFEVEGGVEVHRLHSLTNRLGFLSRDPTRNTPPPYPDPGIDVAAPAAHSPGEARCHLRLWLARVLMLGGTHRHVHPDGLVRSRLRQHLREADDGL